MTEQPSMHQDTVSGKLIRVNVERERWFAGVVFDGTRNINVSGSVAVIPTINSDVVLRGTWEEHPKYGRQFKFTSCEATMPTDRGGVIAFLETVPQIGNVRARMIVDRLGNDAIEKILTNPSCIRGIGQIGDKAITAIKADLNARKTLIECEGILSDMGIAPRTRRRLAEEIGEHMIEIVKENPYGLIVYEGIAFWQIDRFVMARGLMSQDDPRRAAAISVEALKQRAEDGDTYADRDFILRGAQKLKLAKPISPQVLQTGIDVAVKECWIMAVKGGYALHNLAMAEANIANTILGWLSENYELGSIQLLNEELLNILTDEQREAVENGIKNRVCVVTGGPGRGKTFTSKAILEAFGGAKIGVVTPTGKAAKRASELTGYPASTIHRFIGQVRSNQGSDNPKPIEEIIPQVTLVDEASMVDVQLFSLLLSTISLREDARIIIVGDVDQLPSISAGRLLADIIESGAVPTVRLTKALRQAGDSPIVRNAYAINNGEMPDTESTACGGWMFGELPDVETAAVWVKALLTKRVPALGLDPIKDVQILTGQKTRDLGTHRMNELVRGILNPHHPSKTEYIRERTVNEGGKAVKRMLCLFRVGDKVMVTENDYELNVVNGDQGIVSRIELSPEGKKAEDKVYVQLDSGYEVMFQNGDVEKLVQAWAVTVHKSQGSEYPMAVVMCHECMPWALQRALIYTAVTRAKKHVVMLATKNAIAKAVKGETRLRLTRLGGLLAERKVEVA